MIDKYILDENGDPVLTESLIEWAEWFEKADRKLARDEIGPYIVSTVFLGTDHSMSSDRDPILWETMIFAKNAAWDPLDEQCWRYRSRAEALEGHQRALEACRYRIANPRKPSHGSTQPSLEPEDWPSMTPEDLAKAKERYEKDPT